MRVNHASSSHLLCSSNFPPHLMQYNMHASIQLKKIGFRARSKIGKEVQFASIKATTNNRRYGLLEPR